MELVGGNMPFCENCYAEIRIGERACPQCGNQQPLWWEECGLKGIFKETPSRTSIRPQATSFEPVNEPTPTSTLQPEILDSEENDNYPNFDLENLKVQVDRLLERALERFEAGRAWLGSKDRIKARREFQKAFNYYGEVLKLDPRNEQAREFRAKCLQKIC